MNESGQTGQMLLNTLTGALPGFQKHSISSFSVCVGWPEGVGSDIEAERAWMGRAQSQRDPTLTA